MGKRKKTSTEIFQVRLRRFEEEQKRAEEQRLREKQARRLEINRKIAEEKLRDTDIITIGKFDLEYHTEVESHEKMSDLDGTMILNTKKQKEMLKGDQEDKQLVKRSGCSVLVGLEKTFQDEVPLDMDMITVGKSKFVNVRVGGWFVPAIQARIIREGESFTILNVGKKGKTRVNGDEVTRQDIKNGDIIEVGNSVFRFVEAG